MPDGDVLRATLEGTFAAEPVMIDLGFVSGAGMPDFASDAAALFDALYVALDFGTTPGAYMGPLSGGYRVNSIRIQDLAPGISAGLTFPVGVVGSNIVEDALPPQLALCVTWRTALKGKANRGRSYLTGFAEDSQNSGYWIPEIQTWADEGFATPLLTAFGPTSSTGYRLSVVHTMSAGVRLTPPTADPVISFTVHNETRSLRRRGPGVRISRRRAAP